MIVRGTDMATGHVIEINVVAPLPQTKRLEVAQVARRYNRGAVTINRWVKAKLIPHFCIAGQVFFDPDVLTAFERSQQGLWLASLRLG